MKADITSNSIVSDDIYGIRSEIFNNNDKSKSTVYIKLYNIVKRFYDILFSLCGLLLLSPLFLIIALLIKLDDHGPVFYIQERYGKNCVPFKMLKFRSMCLNADEKIDQFEKLNERDGPAFKIKDDPRITNIGKFIRKTCIDELPQLINIIKGDMSIVGPRPPLPEEVRVYTEYQKQRLSVIPGLTCFWQVNKTQETTFEEWVEMDLKYIKEKSLLLDFRLILSTVMVVIKGNGDQ